MPVDILLPLLLLVLLVLMLLRLGRRAAAALARARAVAAFQHEVAELAERVSPIVDDLERRVDAVRHHQLPADEVREALGSAHATFDGERAGLQGWRPPTGFADAVTYLADDLDRCSRAVEMIDFGTQLAVDGTSHQRELESQTAIKRGYLNLLHARQSFVDHVAAVAARTDEARERWRPSRI